MVLKWYFGTLSSVQRSRDHAMTRTLAGFGILTLAMMGASASVLVSNDRVDIDGDRVLRHGQKVLLPRSLLDPRSRALHRKAYRARFASSTLSSQL